MKKMKLLTLVASLIGLATLINCKSFESEVDANNCSDIDYKIISSSSTAQLVFYLRTPDGEPFTEDVTVAYTVYYERDTGDPSDNPSSSYAVTVPMGSDSSVLIHDSRDPERQAGGFCCKHTMTNATISTENCEDAIEKDEDDIAADTEEVSCNDLAEFTIYPCTDEYTLEWTGQNLTGNVLNIYGKEINLASQTSVTFSVDELDLDQQVGVITNGDASCEVTEMILGTCPGTTGTLAITDPVAASDDFIVTVEDADLAGNGDFDLTVTTGLGESESLTLSESTTGVFVGTLSTVLSGEAGTNDDGSLNIENGVVISVTYDDELDAEANDPDAITVTVTTSGDFAPTCIDGIQNGDEEGVDCGGSCENACESADVTYNGISYSLAYGSYIDFSSLDGSVTFSMNNSNEAPDFYVEIILVSNDDFVSETYTVGGATYLVGTNGSSVKVGNEAGDGDVFTSGSVILTIDEMGYTLDMNLSTSVSTLVGTYVIPFAG